jgi:hypothetical protein
LGGGLRGRGRMPGLPLAFSPPGRRGDRMEDLLDLFDDLLDDMVEDAMEDLRYYLSGDELQRYEELYNAFKKSSGEERRKIACEILSKHFHEVWG